MNLLAFATNILFRVDVGNPGGSGYASTEPPKIDAVIGNLVTLINTFLFTLGPILLVAMIAYGGVMRLFAADNPQGIKQSNQVIFYAIVGYALVTVGFLVLGLSLGVVNFSGGINSLFQLNFK